MTRTIGFTSRDAAQVRFGLSCLWEVLASLRVLREPSSHSVHLPWVRQVRPQVEVHLAGAADAEVRRAFNLLGDLVGSGVHGHYAPDLLTPPPTSLEPSIETELHALIQTPSDVVHEQLAHLRDRWTPRLQEFADDPARRLERLADVIARYWHTCLVPYWPRIIAMADAEVFLRSQQQAVDGTAALLNDLHDRVRWNGESLTVAGTACLGAHDLEGGGLCLVPSVFVWPSVLVVADSPTAQVAFPCRGVGTLWHGGSPTPRALERVIGRSKARLLTVLHTPLSTTDAAARLGLSVSATSEHLTALRAAGLVQTRRSGRLSLNVRTAVADALVAGSG
ncbi:MAG: helix-turn-helix domain-containing protein [Streptosporangiales bacterium]|nr:helix-turn-helix domain-containing protein [Streptosporangiales bacterium]